MSHEEIDVRCQINGERLQRRVRLQQGLAEFLHADMRLVATRVSCDDGSCPSCSVRLDGKVVRACMMLAVQADKCSIVTIEALTASGEIADLLSELAARQLPDCTRCRPGQLFTAAELLAEGEPSTIDEIRSFMAGNACDCGSFEPMAEAIEATMKKRAGSTR